VSTPQQHVEGAASFTHLHVHSHYTLLGGTASVSDLAQRAAESGMSHLALTDTNALYGVIAFARACTSAGIQPIVGMATSIALPGDLQEGSVGAEPPGLVILLARDRSGYRSLCRLSSLLQGHADREARLARGLSLDDLAAHADGLLCLDGGRQGWTERLLRMGHLQAARRYAGRLAHIYGPHTYLSLELQGADDAPVGKELSSLAHLLGTPPVAVQPVYCLSRQDVPRLRLLAAIARNCPLDELPAEAVPGGGDPRIDLHWLGVDEMRARYAAFPDALARVTEVADGCGEALPDGRPIFPTLDLPEGTEPEDALADLARTGVAARYGAAPPAAVTPRLERELSSIAGHGYAPLFLIVADVVRFARAHDIPVSTRGSVANSLVAYCVGITTVDPVANELLFERFLSPARVGAGIADAPDIDLDLCSRRRDEVLRYVHDKYGADRVCLVATVSTLQRRSAVRETAKAYRLEETQIAHLTRLLPRGWHPDPRRRDMRPIEDVLDQVDDPRARRVLREASALVGTPHHLSVHPGGVIIAPGPLTDLLPVQWSPKGGEGGLRIAQFDHVDIEALGLPKLDLLGIRALSVLADAAELVRRDSDPGFRLSSIPTDDPQTADLLSHAETIGVFQCESSGMRATLRKLRARTPYDLAVTNAFFKPGPSLGGMAHAFVQRYRGLAPVRYLHPALEPILASTKGVLIFQEQILRVAVEIAGLNWAQADQLRRGVKFRAEAMTEMEVQFVTGCQRPPPGGPGMTAQQAQALWEQILPFSGYGFNRGHAMAYAEVSYRSAYIKAHWPAAYLCARLHNWGGYHHPAMYMAEAVRLGIDVRPPHINHSDHGFTLAWEGGRPVLWMGLGWVRDLRSDAARAIIAARAHHAYAGPRDLAIRVPLQGNELAHLVQCGALDGLGESRAALLAESHEILRAESALQLAFEVGWTGVEPEGRAQRVSWEEHVLGYPLSTLHEPLWSAEGTVPVHVPLDQLPATRGRPVVTAGVRLPGWSGGKGFYLWDGTTWVLVQYEAHERPPAWEPLVLHGHWATDEWGSGWFQVQRTRSLGGNGSVN